jgi:PncC family amidohydrolase
MNAALAEEVVKMLKNAGMTVTTVESCTGGLISATLVDVAGASAVLNQAYVTYANEAKQSLVGVKAETLEAYGAVSEQTAREMAEGGAKAANADAALAVTGIAGPDGGTPEKPVGLVYIGCHVNGNTMVERNVFSGTRREVR